MPRLPAHTPFTGVGRAHRATGGIPLHMLVDLKTMKIVFAKSAVIADVAKAIQAFFNGK